MVEGQRAGLKCMEVELFSASEEQSHEQHTFSSGYHDSIVVITKIIWHKEELGIMYSCSRL